MEDFFDRTIRIPNAVNRQSFSSLNIIYDTQTNSKKYSSQVKSKAVSENLQYGWFISIVNFLIRYPVVKVCIKLNKSKTIIDVLSFMFPRISFVTEYPKEGKYTLVTGNRVDAGKIDVLINIVNNTALYEGNPPEYFLIRRRPLYYDDNSKDQQTQEFLSGSKLIFPYMGPSATDILMVINRSKTGKEIINLDIHQNRMNYHNLVIRNKKFRSFSVYPTDGKKSRYYNYDDAFFIYVIGQYLYYCVNIINPVDLQKMVTALKAKLSPA